MKKISVFTLLLAFILLFSSPEFVKADEVQEWTNFAEWCYYNGIDFDSLPVDYNENYYYVYLKYNSNYYLLGFEKDNLDGVFCNVSSSGTLTFYSINDAEVVSYRSNDSGGWDAYPTFNSVTISELYYCDFALFNKTGDTLTIHATKSGEYVQWMDAVNKLSASQKSKLQSYSNYIVYTVPVRANDWKSEQHVIICSDASKAIFRDEAYNALCFTTGSGKESGYVLIFDSQTMTWQVYDSSYAYGLGCTVASGGGEPIVAFSNVDIYYEDGVNYALDSEVWCSAMPYYIDVTPTPIPVKQEVVTSGFPRLFEVTDNVGLVRTYADADSNAVIALGKGKGGFVYSVEYDNSGDAWYKVGLVFNGTEYEGYILADSVYVGYSAPSVGGGDSGSTVTPTVTPSGGSSDGGSSGGTRPDGGGSLNSSGGLSFIVNLFKLIWTEICSIPMSVDGYSISIQQIIVYGALVTIVGGFLLSFIFKR